MSAERNLWVGDAFAGVGLGALTGLLLGLSVSQTVASVITALAAILAGFFGLSNAASGISSVRIGAFGIACAMSVVTGVWLRAGNRLSTTPAADVKLWTDAGYPQEEARRLVASGRGIQLGPDKSILYSVEAQQQCVELFRVQDGRKLLQEFAKYGGKWVAAANKYQDNPDGALTYRDIQCDAP
jgi:hypothetical protein